MKLFTIGFTKTTAESFFERLAVAGVDRVVDVRISNTSQLAGFAKKADIEYFLRAISGIGYEHQPELAPSEEMFKRYQKTKDWDTLAPAYAALLEQRKVESTLDPAAFEGACLLCSEHEPSTVPSTAGGGAPRRGVAGCGDRAPLTPASAPTAPPTGTVRRAAEYQG